MSVGITALLALTPALAADGAWWAGEWGVDPSRSDDATKMIEQAYIGPSVSSGSARRFSPDGDGDVDVDASRRKLLYRLMGVLGQSGRLSLADTPDGRIALGWGEGPPLQLEPGRKWTRVTDDDGEKYKIRVQHDRDWLTVERKVAGAVVTETLVPPSAPGELVVVVSIVGSELDSGIEFRRVYRPL